MSEHRALRGVNFGGWLVLERWMTPRLFSGTDARDEYTFMQTDDARAKIDSHRKSFVTESDFRWLNRHKIDLIRLPVGYWVLQSDGPYVEAKKYLDWAFFMAEKYSLGILLDLHGAPGSQNGNDHSGKIGRAGWFKNKKLRQDTIEVLSNLDQRYEKSPAYWGLELINEPRSPLLYGFILRKFYKQAAKELGEKSRYLIFHDAFRPRIMNGSLGQRRHVAMDMHIYHMANGLRLFLHLKQYLRRFSSWYGKLIKKLAKRQPIIIGEWSAVIRGESLKSLGEDTANELMYEFGQSQVDLYDGQALAWFYWNYKTDDPGVWNFKSLVDDKKINLSR